MRPGIRIIAFCLVLLLAGCAGRSVPPRDGSAPSWMGTPADVRDFPQNLEFYARRAGAGTRLVDAAEQARLNAAFDRTLFGPWEMGKTSIRKREVAAIFRKARGFRRDGARWSQPEWDAMARNARLSAFPNAAAHAITLRATDLREMPTHEPRFSEPTPDARANPFDYFQYSRLPPATPLLVAHVSDDGRWYYVECPVAGGWVDAGDVAFVDAEFKRLWRAGSYAALIRDKVRLDTAPVGADGADGAGVPQPDGVTLADIGTVLPLTGVNADGSLNVLVPLPPAVTPASASAAGGTLGLARSAEITLSPADAARKPLPLTPEAVARVGNVMMGQRYGWGGMFGERDCSALTRDLLTPFGLWLPRNSSSQARRGVVVPLEGLSQAEKERRILAEGVPFLSLVGMRGHITLYVGEYRGRAAIFHNVWGVRVVSDGNDDDRFVIGRAVVTSLTPGSELKNLYLPVTFADRIRTLSTPAAARP